MSLSLSLDEYAVNPSNAQRPDEHVVLAQRTLQRVATVALATASATGQPWNSPVYAAFDGRAFYWCSLVDAIHSLNIAENSAVFLAIFDSTGTDQSGRGVYARATARELTDPFDIERGLRTLGARKGEPAKPVDDHVAPQPRRVYVAVPDTMWTNRLHHEDGYYFDERVPLDINALQPTPRRRRPSTPRA
jgi:hypothetical protein